MNTETWQTIRLQKKTVLENTVDQQEAVESVEEQLSQDLAAEKRQIYSSFAEFEKTIKKRNNQRKE
jgi:hypothetical protein